MGLAILPARLGTELLEVEKYLLNQDNQMDEIHKAWAEQLKMRNILLEKRFMPLFKGQ